MKARRRPSLAELERQVAAFNRIAPAGTSVSVRRDNGTSEITKTTSAASVLSGHTAVVWLEGISGCYLLERVSPIAKVIA